MVRVSTIRASKRVLMHHCRVAVLISQQTNSAMPMINAPLTIPAQPALHLLETACDLEPSPHRPGGGFLVFANRGKEHVNGSGAPSDKSGYRIHVGDCRGLRHRLTDGARDYLAAEVARILASCLWSDVELTRGARVSSSVTGTFVPDLGGA